MTGLTERTCVPCRGGVPPLTESEANALLEQTAGWTLIDGQRIERNFEFGNFRDALGFVDGVGALAEEQGHHPDITFGWGYAKISLYTHKIGGLHENDFILAAKINRL